MLKIESAVKTFFKGTPNEHTALDHLSLSLKEGEFVTIVGSNGAGKSTLFNAVCGTFMLDAGAVILDGKDITYQPDYRRAKTIGRVFQDPMKGTALNLTIEENLALAYSRKKKPLFSPAITSSEMKLFREKLAEMDMGLEDRMKTKVGLLSGGQRQVVTLLMCTMNVPKLLLLDEHTAALDPQTSENAIEQYTTRKDEIGNIANAVNMLCISLKSVTIDIGRILGEMADENFAVDTEKNKAYYIGDFKVLSDNLEAIKNKLATVLTNIYSAAEQVNSGSDQVAAGAQTLSQGTIAQTVSIEELAKNLETIEMQVKENSDNCTEAHKLMNSTSSYLNNVNEKMSCLTDAMTSINSTSNKISNIIKAIEDIAFQTNILALNAAVEAARAGEAGKGFAVVADEVRNLAAKSAEAVSDTTRLIDSSVEAVNSGSEITAQTAEALNTLVKCTNELKNIVDDITESGSKQADMVIKINEDINRISNVVQTNSATAEESAAASEELSGQAGMLKKLIGTFKL